VMLLGLVDTLEYFYRGGRLSRTGKIAGTLLGFKPLLMLRDGALTMLGKARGSSAGIELLLREVEQRGCIDPSAPVYFGYTLTDEKCRMLRSRAVERFALREPAMFSVGCVIGTHAGPGACVFTYLAQK
ncbi:MAG: DegV family protein, partial [Oscillospiraceae bacterium]